jgi:hypothetical protein
MDDGIEFCVRNQINAIDSNFYVHVFQILPDNSSDAGIEVGLKYKLHWLNTESGW